MKHELEHYIDKSVLKIPDQLHGKDKIDYEILYQAGYTCKFDLMRYVSLYDICISLTKRVSPRHDTCKSAREKP